MRRRFVVPLPGDRSLVLGDRAQIMGVINVTPDSFSDGGRYVSAAAAIEHAHRLIESGAVKGKNFVQVGLRGYFPDRETLAWMSAQGMRTHFMTEIEERGAEAVIRDAIAEALDGPDAIWISVDIDVVDPGLAPGTGTPEPGGLLTRELLRALRQIAERVPVAGMDILEVAPPYDWAESTAMIANRAALEVISALAKRKAAGESIRWEPRR